MRKIPSEIENPFDDLLINISEYLAPYYKQLNFTANGITTLSLITGIYSIFLYTNQYYYLSALFFIISYYFDCQDGYFARRYNESSQFGDYYDHIKDIIINASIGILLFLQYFQIKSNIKYIILIIVILILATLQVHMGCQEIYFNKNPESSQVLNPLKKLCPAKNKNDIYNVMQYTKFFGSGTFILLIVVLILLSPLIDNKILL